MHIVVFPGWYPGKLDKLSGDFIQRHMYAIALHTTISVVIPVKDRNIKKVERMVEQRDNLTEIYIYYPSVSSILWIDGIASFLRYNYLCIATARSLNKKNRIDLAHLYVLQKNHITGLLLKWLYTIPYVISEQSTFYVDGSLERAGSISRSLWRYAFNKAVSFHAVSNYLLKSIKEKLEVKTAGVVIPNVVNADLFNYQPRRNAVTTFAHVSNMAYQKNVEGMLKAFAKVKKENNAFVLNLVGPMPSHIKDLINQLQLDANVVIWNERNYKEVAGILQQSDVFVFFTRYETFGCVIIEANACGLPVILSDLDVTRELIEDGQTGLFVQNENVEQLAEKILYIINNPSAFDGAIISASTRDRFNYEVVGKQFIDWYRKSISA